MNNEEEILVVKELGWNEPTHDDEVFRGKGLFVEFRDHKRESQYKLIQRNICKNHYEVIRYLLKDHVHLLTTGHFAVTSSEIDEDRGVYVLYGELLNE